MVWGWQQDTLCYVARAPSPKPFGVSSSNSPHPYSYSIFPSILWRDSFIDVNMKKVPTILCTCKAKTPPYNVIAKEHILHFCKSGKHTQLPENLSPR